ncbi:MAG: cysteine--tRNA ligase [Sandaracinobacter sp.]
MPDLLLYDSFSRAKQPVRTPEPGKPITLYVCGPTVYGRAHIGNARPAVVFDTLYRLLRHLHGAENVRYARNITDIDDKIMAKAVAENRSPQAVAAEFEQAYFADMGELGCLTPDFNPRATEHIAGDDGMIAMIAALIARGFAYAVDGHVLFEVSTFEGYGRLSKRPMDEMIAGARVEVAPYKRSPGDFVLWKPSTEDQPGWESPWGLGRPGWHIECSAMIRSVLGQETIDIHGGGLDLQFPHHENERAQSCCAHGGAELARIWMHNGFLTMGETKMSKSLGNIITPRELLDAGWPGEVLRLALLSAHYRQPLQWTDALLEQSKAKLDRIYRRKAEGTSFATDASGQSENVGLQMALLDDLNTPEALASLEWGDRVLGFGLAEPVEWFQGGQDTGAIEDQLVRYRRARDVRDWTTADAIRDALKADGIEISVAKDGTTSWRRA